MEEGKAYQRLFESPRIHQGLVLLAVLEALPGQGPA
jgi:hypothetical protein